jgi:hypothetical protein
VRTYLALSLIALAACKGKPEHRPPPQTLGSATAMTGSNSKRAAPDLALPQAPPTPPLKTTRKLGRADFEQLAKLEYPGFQRQPHGLNDVVFEMRQVTNDHPRLWTTITIEPCDAGSAAGSGSAASDCWPMDIELWKKREDEVKKQWLGEALYGAPDVDWEMGKMVYLGATMIWTYQLGQHAGSGSGGGTFAYTDAFILFYNDGVNKIRVVAEYKDDPVKSKEMMAQLAPRPDLQALGTSFMGVYTHAWPTK